MKRVVKFLISGFNQLLWPAICSSCSQRIPEANNKLCDDCWSQLLSSTAGYYCRRCGRDTSAYSVINGRCAQCQNEEIVFDSIARAGTYDNAFRKIILEFKNGQTQLKNQLRFLTNAAMQGSEFFNEIDYLVPVPLHWKKRFIRGYNQAHIIASVLDGITSKINTDLVRIKNTRAQFSLTPTKRKKNVEGAFALRKNHDFSGKRICLVDDIKTTGATLNECSRILKDAGAQRVYALVLAVAGQKKDE